MRFPKLVELSLNRLAKSIANHGNPTMEQQLDAYRRAGMSIGDDVLILRSVLDSAHPELLTIGNNCTITEATILAHDDSLILFEGKRRAAPVTIGDRVFIGAGAIVLPGVTIGSDVIVGAGSIVTHDVPEGVVVAGNPAKVLEPLERWLAKRRHDPAVLAVQVGSNRLTPHEAEQLRMAAIQRFER